jgi:hypothetical protein
MEKTLLDFLASAEIQRKLLLLRALSIIFSLFFLGFSIWSFRRVKILRSYFFRRLKEFLDFKAFEVSQFAKKWEKVRKRLSRPWETEAKLAIIEADGLLNEVLEKMAYPGERLGQKLRQINDSLLPNVEKLRQVHQLRNDIVHDPDYRLPRERAEEALDIYEQAFKYLNAF